MDTKLKDSNKENKISQKDNKNRSIINIISIIVIVIVAIAMVGIYSQIDVAGSNSDKKNYNNKLYLYVINKDFSEELSKNTFVIYKKALEIMQGNATQASDIYLKPESEFDDKNDYNVFKDKINDSLKDWKKDLENDYLNLDYAVLDKDKNVINSNNENKLSSLINSRDASTLKDKYSFYVSIEFDEKGDLDINDIYIENGDQEINTKRIIRDYLLYYKLRKIIYTDNNDVFNPIKNMTFIYGINKDLKYYDKISRAIDVPDHRYETVTHMYIFIFSVIIIILSSVIPFKLEKEISICKKFFKVPFEINAILLSITISFLFYRAPDLIRDYVNGSFAKVILSETLKIEPIISDKVIYLFNFCYWLVFIISIFISVVLIKKMYIMGLIKYFKEKTITVVIIRFVKRKIENVFGNIAHMIKYVDVNDKSNKFILKIVVIDAAAILSFFILWVIGTLITNSLIFSALLGILLAFTYCTIMFNLLKKYLIKVKNMYLMLFDATNEIGKGNFEVSINEDLGLFNPFKEQIKKIQAGFKKAVDEEVKSQKMKTELISNVSHDLKTPLTSIITYVDLLKNKNITEEERKTYIDTLDRKSQRLKFLIEDLFEVSKATSGNITLNLVKVDIVELMKQMQFELEDKINNSGLKIKNNFPSNKMILELDSQKTFRIFENLLNNVIKYAMKESRVYIDIIEDKESVEIIMRNMSAEEINFNAFDIVERFQRGDKSRNTEGSGLGLAIVKSFVEAQRGTFNIDIDGDLFKVIIIFRK